MAHSEPPLLVEMLVSVVAGAAAGAISAKLLGKHTATGALVGGVTFGLGAGVTRLGRSIEERTAPRQLEGAHNSRR